MLVMKFIFFQENVNIKENLLIKLKQHLLKLLMKNQNLKEIFKLNKFLKKKN